MTTKDVVTTEKPKAGRPGRRMRTVALGAATSAGLAGATLVTMAPPASAHCGQYWMTTNVSGWRYGSQVNTSGCSGTYDVLVSSVSYSTYYHALYQNANGTWVNADVNAANNGMGPFLSQGSQNPWKAMITNLSHGRGIRLSSYGGSTYADVWA